jgi:hypothetical protein
VSDESAGEHAVELGHAAVRGAVAAMAMSGFRVVTKNLGLVEQTPPQAMVRQKAHGLLRMVPRKRRLAAIQLAHWGYGAGGGVAFRLLPRQVRLQPWAGPAYGLVVWLGFELGIAPVLGLSQSKKPRPLERAAFALDHLLYGYVLSEFRAQPQETSA